jgi:hypothetical protein
MNWVEELSSYKMLPGSDPWEWLEAMCYALDRAEIPCILLRSSPEIDKIDEA